MMAIGKMTASVPKLAPVTLCVSGRIAVMKMMNGMGRMMFTSMLSTENTPRLASTLPGRVT